MRLFQNRTATIAPAPRRSLGRPACRLSLTACAAGLLATISGRATTLAHWHFDPTPAVGGAINLADAGPHGHTLVLGPGAVIVPGRTGHALRPSGGEQAGISAFSLRRPQEDAATSRPRFANVTDSKLNLGADDWTIDGWFRLDPEAAVEGVVLEIGSDPRRPDDLSTRLSVLPRDHAFLLSGLAPVRTARANAVARLVEFPNPEGPPAGVAHRFTAALVATRPLPRGVWFHAAIVQTGGRLHLLLDGQHCATTAVDLLPLPRSAEGYLALGRDGHGRHPFPGAIDELRISDHVVFPVGPDTGRHSAPRPSP
jgi:hypothetical protein